VYFVIFVCLHENPQRLHGFFCMYEALKHPLHGTTVLCYLAFSCKDDMHVVVSMFSSMFSIFQNALPFLHYNVMWLDHLCVGAPF